MNKNAIQKYAIWARNELIEQVKQRAFQYDIDENGYGDANASVIAGRVLSEDEKRQRAAFVSEIKKSNYQQAVEEVAYTWFNRFVALRFMEVNDYLPTHVRVFSDANGNFNPEIMQDVLHLELDGLDKTKVAELLNANKTEELYRYLLLTQCNALNDALPEMFEKLGSYTEMLLPNNILKQDSVLARLVNDIDEDDWKDAVQIIGWMYQYYNTEPKQAVFDGLKKNVKITKEKIPAATQLFTPDWIVRYMVENSLGRLWLESHPNAVALKTNWKYYLDEAEQTPEVAEQLRIMRSQSPIKTPEDINLIDPCMGSGHILVYAFDVLMQIYESEGYNPRDAAKLILEKNIYGLDIDRRAYQLAYFSLMMKARQYNRRIFTENVNPQVYHPAGWADGEEYGSLAKVDELPSMPEAKLGQISLDDENYSTALRVWNFKRLLAQKYDAVVTNPPYMGSSGMSGKLSEYVKENYPDSKSDMFAVFIEWGLNMIKPHSYNCMVTMQSWMFLSSFEKMRGKILNQRTITNLLHMENMVMGIAFGTAVANLSGTHVGSYVGQYNHVTMADIQNEKPRVFPPVSKRNTTANAENFTKIPGSPVAYWVSERILSAYASGILLGTLAFPKTGMTTGDNNRFLRLWHEINFNHSCLDATNATAAEKSGKKWFPYCKGGGFKRWYGFNDYLVNWGHNGSEIKNNVKINGSKAASVRSENLYFKQIITWSAVTSGTFSCRICDKGALFDSGGSSIYAKEHTAYLLAILNTKIGQYFLNISNATINYQPGDVAGIPILFSAEYNNDRLVPDLISIAKADWDSFETSWDFSRHPLISKKQSISQAYTGWQAEVESRFLQLKSNEEELNRIFIDIYGLQDELTPDIADKDVTVARIYDSKEDIPESMKGNGYVLTKADVTKSFISYAVGCMFGRYSLDVEGLAYAGGEWDESKYSTFLPDRDNVIPICDDEYFDDDIVGRFVDFVKVVYGADTLEENLKFIGDALGGKGTPREVIRNYFLNDFYKDHIKTYKKRPIYWLFDSGKKHGFKALVYMHRYSSDLLAKLRTDYVHEQQERYRTQLAHIASALDSATGAERAKLLKQQIKLDEQSKEISTYEEKVHHLADQHIYIDLDDGVKVNYAKFEDVLAKIK